MNPQKSDASVSPAHGPGRRGAGGLLVLLAAFAILLIVPASQAFAAPTFKLNVNGSGSGKVTSVEEEPFVPGTPPINCVYNGTSATGVCQNEPGETSPNFLGI